MEFKLTERQSYDILKHLGNYRSLIEKINVEAYDILERYYARYSSVPKNYFFKPMNRAKFFYKICKGSGSIEVRDNNGVKDVFSYNFAEIDKDYLFNKFGIGVEPIAHMIIDEALESRYGKYSVEKVQKMYEMLMTYSNPPFTVDDELLQMYHTVKQANEERISLLANIGIKHEL